MSEKQLPIYYEWGIKGIKAKGKHVPRSWLKSTDNIVVGIEHLKDGYCLSRLHKKIIINKYFYTKDLPIIYEGKLILCKLEGTVPIPIIANPKKVGTPKWYLIKGQDIYSGNLREHQRGFVMDKIKEYYYPFIKDLKPIDFYPCKIKCDVYDTIKNFYGKDGSELGGRWDMDNLMYPYLKAFPDLLTVQGILRDDDRLHLPSTIPAYFVPIDDHEDRKLIFTIEKDDREEIKNNKLFCEFHKEKIKEENDTYESEDLKLVKDDEPFGMVTDIQQRETFKKAMGLEDKKPEPYNFPLYKGEPFPET